MDKQVTKPSGVRSDEVCIINIEAEDQNTEELRTKPVCKKGHLKNNGSQILSNFVKQMQ